MGFFYTGLPPSLMCLETCQNAALQDLNAVVLILDDAILSDGQNSILRLYH